MGEEKKDNTQIAQSVSGFLDKYADKLWKGVKYVYKAAANEARANWRLGYETYLNNALRKYSTAKPFLSANRPTPLGEFYVPLGVSCDETVINETSITDLTETNKFAVIMASAGSGKSMLMQYLFVDTIKQTHLVPVFVELRDLNNTDLTLFDLIKKKLRDNGFDFDDEYINVAIKAGHFAFFFDGFDEIANDKREQAIDEIQDLTKFNENYFLLSSRFDDSLNGWKLFDVWKVQPLTLELTCQLIEKRPEIKEVKDKFIKALREELFERHKSFLSNPLLLSIMLITYKDRASIPEQLNIFYDNAYIALFDRHDAQKSYSREKLSKLNIKQFEKVFAAFCFASYNRQQFSFSDTKIRDYFEIAQKLTSINFNKDAFLEDLIQGVCLLIRDGMRITFSHNSFQEYFTAVRVTQLNNSLKQSGFIHNYFLNKFSLKDLTFDLIYELIPEVVEKLFLIPQIEFLERKFKSKEVMNDYQYSSYIKNTSSKLIYIETPKDRLNNNIEWGPYRTVEIELCYFIISHYKELVGFELESSKSPNLQNFIRKVIDYRKTYEFPNQNSNSISFQSLVKNRKLIDMLKNSNHLLSQNAFEKIIEIKNLLIKKHREQEAYLDLELED